jgi:GxxExxY protein
LRFTIDYCSVLPLVMIRVYPRSSAVSKGLIRWNRRRRPEQRRRINADGHRLDRNEMSHLTERVIRCAFAVSNTLGCGFLEKVYENALAHELRKAGLQVRQQHAITVYYDGVAVGEYTADLLVEGVLLVELKAVKDLDDVHLAQCLNYLKATDRRLCLLTNFAKPKLEVRRIVNKY